VKRFSSKLGGAVSEHEIVALLAEFLASKLMIELEGQYLSLAVIRNPVRCAGTGGRLLEKQSRPIPAPVNLV